MFCRKCGIEMNDGDKFCHKCGTSIEQEVISKKIVEDNSVKFTLKPEFNLPYKMLTAMCMGGGISIIFILEFIEYGVTIELLMLILLINIICIFLYLIFGKLQYDKLEYNFYATKVEYIDGFFNKEEKELKYKFIREVTMSQNVLERFCGIGQIKIFTNASNGYSSNNNHNNTSGRNGIYIHCVVDVEDQYKKIKQIIDEGTPDE